MISIQLTVAETQNSVQNRRQQFYLAYHYFRQPHFSDTEETLSILYLYCNCLRLIYKAWTDTEQYAM